MFRAEFRDGFPFAAEFVPEKTMGAVFAQTTEVDRQREEYSGAYDITPSKDGQILETAKKVMTDDVLIRPIPYAAVSNEYGTTVTIGG